MVEVRFFKLINSITFIYAKCVQKCFVANRKNNIHVT